MNLTELKNLLQGYEGQREQLKASFHQLSGAIDVLTKLISETETKEGAKEDGQITNEDAQQAAQE